MEKTNCPNCGAPIGYSDICPYCGTRLSWIPVIANTLTIVRPNVRKCKAVFRVDKDMSEMLQDERYENFIFEHIAQGFVPYIKENMDYRVERDVLGDWMCTGYMDFIEEGSFDMKNVKGEF